MELPYAEEIKHYWQTSSSSPDVWINNAKKEIAKIGGTVLAEGFGASQGRSAFMLSFDLSGKKYKVVFPVLPTKTGKELSARRQAATLLYHDIKAKCMTASILGNEAAFFNYLMLPDGRSASELAQPELTEAFPLRLKEKNNI